MSVDDKLIALAKSLKLTGAHNTDAALSKKLLIDAMASGSVIVHLQKRVAAPPKKAEELPAGPLDYPQVQSAPPLIPSFLADPENGLKLASQSTTLLSASGAAAPFCSQCEKEDKTPEKSGAAGTTSDAATKTNAAVDAGAGTTTAINDTTTSLTQGAPDTTTETTSETASETAIKASDDTTPKTDDATADTAADTGTNSPINTDTIPDINPDITAPLDDINQSPQNTPLTDITDNITNSPLKDIPSPTSAGAITTGSASASKGAAAIAAASTATTAAAALAGNNTAASALADAPATNSTSEYSDYPDENDTASSTDALTDASETNNKLNPEANNPAPAQTPIDAPTSASENINTATSDTATDTGANTISSATTAETLTTGSAEASSNINTTSIATGAAATAAAVASPLIAKTALSKDSKTPTIKSEIEDVLRKEESKVSLRQKNYQYRKELASNAGNTAKQQEAAERLIDNNDNILRAEAASYVYEVDEFNRGFIQELPPAPVGLNLLDAKQIAGLENAVFTSNESGFGAALFKTDINGEMFLTYRGTNNGVTGKKDWKTNGLQGAGKETEQYNQAMRLAVQLQEALGDDVIMVGHSLAGGLASAGTAVTGNPGYTFNSAGLHPKTAVRFGGMNNEAAGKLIQTRAVEGEVLTGVQRHGDKVLSGLSAGGGAVIGGPAGAAVGYLLSKALPDVPQAIGEMKTLPSIAGGSPIARHGMDQVIDGIEAQKKDDIETLTS